MLNQACFEPALCAGQGQAEGSYEYLVFNSTLLGVAAEHGLHPITDWEDPELDECFDQACAHASDACLLSSRKDFSEWRDCDSGGWRGSDAFRTLTDAPCEESLTDEGMLAG